MPQLPPWLLTTPADYLRATEAGAQIGLGVGQTRVNARNALAQQLLEGRRLTDAESQFGANLAFNYAQLGEQTQLRKAQQEQTQQYHAAELLRHYDQLNSLNAWREQQAQQKDVQLGDTREFRAESLRQREDQMRLVNEMSERRLDETKDYHQKQFEARSAALDRARFFHTPGGGILEYDPKTDAFTERVKGTSGASTQDKERIKDMYARLRLARKNWLEYQPFPENNTFRQAAEAEFLAAENAILSAQAPATGAGVAPGTAAPAAPGPAAPAPPAPAPPRSAAAALSAPAPPRGGLAKLLAMPMPTATSPTAAPPPSAADSLTLPSPPAEDIFAPPKDGGYSLESLGPVPPPDADTNIKRVVSVEREDTGPSLGDMLMSQTGLGRRPSPGPVAAPGAQHLLPSPAPRPGPRLASAPPVRGPATSVETPSLADVALPAMFPLQAGITAAQRLQETQSPRRAPGLNLLPPGPAQPSAPSRAMPPTPTTPIGEVKTEKNVDAYTNIRERQTLAYNSNLLSRMTSDAMATLAKDLGIWVKHTGTDEFETRDKRAEPWSALLVAPPRMRSGQTYPWTISREKLSALILDELSKQRSILRQ